MSQPGAVLEPVCVKAAGPGEAWQGVSQGSPVSKQREGKEQCRREQVSVEQVEDTWPATEESGFFPKIGGRPLKGF